MSETRTIVVEVSGGVVTDVHGLPEGWDYNVADWDDVESGDMEAEVVEKMIEDAGK